MDLNKKGFTMMEVLVAIGILVTLSSFIIIQMGGANTSAKDGKRKVDINVLKNAIVSYRTEHYGVNPIQTTPCQIGNDCPTEVTNAMTPYLATIPTDPNENIYYTYQTNADGTDCDISAILSDGSFYKYSCSSEEFTSGTLINGVCGSANKEYPYSDTSYGSDSICVTGTANPMSPEFPIEGGSITWSCDGANGGTNAVCTSTRTLTPINGLCGAANKAYAYSDTSYGTDTICTTGTADPLSPAFPNQGSSINWSCNGANEGTNASCTASRPLPPITGVCGTAEKTYAASATSYGTDTICTTGTANPTDPAFPAEGGSVEWSCDGANGGTSDSCTASRLSSPINGVCGASNGGTFPSAPTTGLCNAGNPSIVTTAAGLHYSWTCDSPNGGTNASCTASGDLLVNNVHTEADCLNAGGSLVVSAVANKNQCKFSQSVNPASSSAAWTFNCPGGWTAYGSYTQTVSTPSSWCKCDWPAECLYLGSACTTGSHGWANAAQETCGYGCAYGVGCSGYVNYTCYANISARGCY